MPQELDGCQKAFLAPMREAHGKLSALAAQHRAATPMGPANVEALKLLLAAMRYNFRIFYSLCSMGLSDVGAWRAKEGRDRADWYGRRTVHAFAVHETRAAPEYARGHAERGWSDPSRVWTGLRPAWVHMAKHGEPCANHV